MAILVPINSHEFLAHDTTRSGSPVLSLILFLSLPLAWLAIDAVAPWRSRHFSDSGFTGGVSRNSDFSILVPIYGDAKYLENIEFLSRYHGRVILCTTSGESREFYASLERLSRDYGFQIYRSPYRVVTHSNKRATGGMTRDRVIRDALQFAPMNTYAVCIDADTSSSRPLDVLIGALVEANADVASVTLVTQEDSRGLVQLQKFEYRLAMRMRFLAPWLLSGAAHVARTAALREIMSRHSLFFQGNDVETGILARRLGFRVIHIPFEFRTMVPTTWRAWWRQRLAWSGGEFRLFIVNFAELVRHPFFWFYGAVVTLTLFAFRWYAVSQPTVQLALVLALYAAVVVAIHRRYRNRWLLLMPIYTLFTSLIVVPLGIFWYFLMAASAKNYGVIRVNQRAKHESRDGSDGNVDDIETPALSQQALSQG